MSLFLVPSGRSIRSFVATTTSSSRRLKALVANFRRKLLQVVDLKQDNWVRVYQGDGLRFLSVSLFSYAGILWTFGERKKHVTSIPPPIAIVVARGKTGDEG